MKVLALSLLRIGDFFHHVHLLREIQSQNPGAEIHVLIFSDAHRAIELFPDFHFHEIPRTELQSELVERDRSWRRAFILLQKRIRELNELSCDRVYNLTHTLFAARIMDLLNAPEKKGSQFRDGKVGLESRELRYINEIWAQENEPLLNWIEVTAASVELPAPRLPERPPARAGEIWMQPWTSDQKKNWPLTQWRQLGRTLSSAGFTVRMICAPGEGPLLMTVMGEDLAPFIFEMTFHEMRKRRTDCALLISGDTSALHFAVLESIPVIGLYLGPANPFKTPPWQKGAGIWWGRASCVPCGARTDCSQTRHLCGDSLTASMVASSVFARMKQSDFYHQYSGARWGEIGDLGRLSLRRGSVNEQTRRVSVASFAEA